VNRPGAYVIRRGDTILDLLNQGGGAVGDRADLRKATLQRRGSREIVPIDLFAMLNRNSTTQNYTIDDGDILNIPEGQNLTVKVQGKVQAPGLYPYKEPMYLADALALARGEVVGRSRLSRVLVIRQKQGQPGQFTYIQVDYVRFIRKSDSTQNILLQPGDLVWVPETNTPDFQQISALANVAFILDRVGSSLFGLQFFR
jgi:protein involved in polysaccharide export with SLBB domain